MNPSLQPPTDDPFLSRTIEATIRIGLLIIIAVWCFEIVKPFIAVVIWGTIIAVATHRGYHRLETVCGGRRWLASTSFIVLALVTLIVPLVLLSGTLFEGIHGFAAAVHEGALRVPPPPTSVGDWPLIGQPLQKMWQLASTNLKAAVEPFTPQIKAVAEWLLANAAAAGLGILQFVAAIIIAGVLLAHADAGGRMAHLFAARLAGERGPAFAEVAEATVRSVARGILGVALIQSLLAGIGFLVAGVPAAGVWALLCLLLAVIQIGISPIVIPVIIYLFYTADTVTAVVFLIWGVLVLVLDNVLKPLLLGRGVKVPMLIIFVGTIGGLISSGIIGLFLGAVILALGYELFLAWLNGGMQPPANGTEPERL
jgi:predicted PurR-regulated permease PerM